MYFLCSQGPCWIPQRQQWIFSDIPKSTQYSFSPSTQAVEVFRDPSENSNGNFLDNEGCLLTCEHRSRVLSHTDLTTGVRTVIAAEWEGLPLTSPNDVVQSRRNGAIYFTDPDYGTIAKIGHGGASQQ